MNPLLTVTDDCFIQVYPSGGIAIGDERHLDGLDAPAELRTAEDVKVLIAVLTELLQTAQWEDS